MSLQPIPPTPAIINQRVRFGLQGNEIYDYEAGKHRASSGRLTTQDGIIYDLAKVAAAIQEGNFIDTAIVGRAAVSAKK